MWCLPTDQRKFTVNSNKLPTLVTYRSAEALRDSGIRYAYLKAGMLAALAIAVLLGASVLWLIVKSPEHTGPLRWLLLGLEFAACAAVAVCSRAIEYPQTPRMTLDELEAMRDKMGVPAHVFQQTHDSVLHGSMDEVHAGWKAQELFQRLKNSSGRID